MESSDRSLLSLCVEYVIKENVIYEKDNVNEYCNELLELYKKCDSNWNKVMIYVCQKGDLNFVKLIIENKLNNDELNNFIALRWTILHGHLDIVEYLYISMSEGFLNDFDYILELAAENGHLDIVKFIIKECSVNIIDPNYSKALILSVENGYSDIVKYLINGMSEDHSYLTIKDYQDSLKQAITYKHINIIKYIIEHIERYDLTEFNIEDLFLEIFTFPNLEIINYILNQKFLWDNKNLAPYIANNALNNNVMNNRLEIVKYLVKELPPTIVIIDIHNNNDEPLRLASSNGHLEIIQYIMEITREENYIINSNNVLHALYSAISVGHLKIVKYLIEQFSLVLNNDNNVIYVALSNYYVEIIKYLIEAGANIHVNDDFIFKNAIKTNNLDMVKFLVNKIGHIPMGIFNKCKTPDNLEIIRYLLSIDSNIAANNYTILFSACKYGWLDIVKAIVESSIINSYRILCYILSSTEHGHLDIVQYLIEHYLNDNYDIRIWNKAMQTAVQFGHLNIVKYLIKNGARKDKALQIAIECNYTEIIEYLNQI